MQEIESSNLSEKEKKEALNKLWKVNAQRAFMGKTVVGDINVQLMDSKGKSRIRMTVDDIEVLILLFSGKHHLGKRKMSSNPYGV